MCARDGQFVLMYLHWCGCGTEMENGNKIIIAIIIIYGNRYDSDACTYLKHYIIFFGREYFGLLHTARCSMTVDNDIVTRVFLLNQLAYLQLPRNEQRNRKICHKENCIQIIYIFIVIIEQSTSFARYLTKFIVIVGFLWTDDATSDSITWIYSNAYGCKLIAWVIG